MTHSVDTSQPHSPAPRVITQWAHEQNGPSGRDGSSAWAQQHGLLLTKTGVTTATLSVRRAVGTNPDPQLWHVPRSGQPVTRWQVDYLDYFHHGGGSALFSLQ